ASKVSVKGKKMLESNEEALEKKNFKDIKKERSLSNQKKNKLPKVNGISPKKKKNKPLINNSTSLEKEHNEIPKNENIAIEKEKIILPDSSTSLQSEEKEPEKPIKKTRKYIKKVKLAEPKPKSSKNSETEGPIIENQVKKSKRGRKKLIRPDTESKEDSLPLSKNQSLSTKIQKLCLNILCKKPLTTEKSMVIDKFQIFDNYCCGDCVVFHSRQVVESFVRHKRQISRVRSAVI
ncbi:MAG: hypothetical protein MHPSP_001613, partial [Paramarteilia canceri]